MNCKRMLLVLVWVLCPAVAHASEQYPMYIYDEYYYLAECTLCHTEIPGKEGTARKPFALQVKEYGAAGKDPTSLRNALSQMEAAGRESDADGDGWGDIEELKQQSDPNDYYDPPYAPPSGVTSGSGGSTSSTSKTGGSDAGGSDGSGGNAGAGEPEPAETVTSTTGRTRPRRPPSAPLPPEFETGCHFGAAPQHHALWALPALLVGAVRLRRRP